MSHASALCCLLALLALAAHGYASDRVALLIGNADYKVQPLANPVNDAVDIAALLGRLGFSVNLLTNATQEQMESAIQAFGDVLDSESVALFYYSGHGAQYEGSNFLIPVDSISQVSVPDHLRYKTIDAGYVLGVMKHGRSRLNIMLLDACRDNPFRSFARGMQKGLARMPGPEGTVIGYATAPGDVALDGQGRNSPYAAALIRFMGKPNIPLEILLREVRASVRSETQGKQSPWYESSIDSDFYFSRANVSASSVANELQSAQGSPKFDTPIIMNPRIYLLAGPRSGREPLFSSYWQALESVGFQVLGAKLKDDSGRPGFEEVRFFHPEDEAQAAVLANVVGANLSKPDIKAVRYSDTKAKPGYIELWFGK